MDARITTVTVPADGDFVVLPVLARYVHVLDAPSSFTPNDVPLLHHGGRQAGGLPVYPYATFRMFGDRPVTWWIGGRGAGAGETVTLLLSGDPCLDVPAAAVSAAGATVYEGEPTGWVFINRRSRIFEYDLDSQIWTQRNASLDDGADHFYPLVGDMDAGYIFINASNQSNLFRISVEDWTFTTIRTDVRGTDIGLAIDRVNQRLFYGRAGALTGSSYLVSCDYDGNIVDEEIYVEGEEYNGMAYNPADDRIYWQQMTAFTSTSGVKSVGADGSTPGLDYQGTGWQTYGAACDVGEGRFWAYEAGSVTGDLQRVTFPSTKELMIDASNHRGLWFQREQSKLWYINNGREIRRQDPDGLNDELVHTANVTGAPTNTEGFHPLFATA